MELSQILDLLRVWDFSVGEIKDKNLEGLQSSFQAFPSFAHKPMSDHLQVVAYLFNNWRV